jgi:hypothetical protein
MKLVTFTTENQSRLGIVRDDQVIDLAKASDGGLPADMLTFLRQGDAALQLAREIERADGRHPADKKHPKAATTLPLSEVELLTPIPNPSKVIAIGLNYMDHCREQDIAPPEAPIIFAKFPTSVIGPGAAIRWDPTLTRQVDYEVELAVVMGRIATSAPEIYNSATNSGCGANHWTHSVPWDPGWSPEMRSQTRTIWSFVRQSTIRSCRIPRRPR